MPKPKSRIELTLPQIDIIPWSGLIIPDISFNKVLLPEPFLPIIPRLSPSFNEKDISDKTFKWFAEFPFSKKDFDTLLTSNTFFPDMILFFILNLLPLMALYNILFFITTSGRFQVKLLYTV
jgi:hypothetical protein